MNAVEVLDELRRLGVEAIPDPPRIRLRYYGGTEPPLEARPLIEKLRTVKIEALGELARWDGTRARELLSAVFDRADRESPSGCWAWCSLHRPDLRVELDDAFDAINRAFAERNPGALSQALARFGAVVQSAVSAYRGAAVRRRQEEPAPC